MASAIFQYFKFLNNEWTKLYEHKERFLYKQFKDFNNEYDLQYTKIICQNFDEGNDEFDEKNLFKTLDSCNEPQLLSEQILHNENVVYSIDTRNVDMVSTALESNNDPEVETEEIYNRNFYVFETELFKIELPGSTDEQLFKITDLKYPNHKIAAFIKLPEE